MAAIPSKNIRLDIENEFEGFSNVQNYCATNVSNNPPFESGLGLITSISLGGVSTAEIDTTSLASSSKSAITGTLDGGTVDVSFFSKTGQTNGLQFYKPTAGTNTPYNFRIAFTDGSNDLWYLNFSAYIQSTNLEAAVDSAVSGTMTLRITGAVSIETV